MWKLQSLARLILVALAEQNGRLADLLAQVARQQRGALEYRLGWLAGLMEPALVPIMGGVVLAIVLAVPQLPIIEANQLFRMSHRVWRGLSGLGRPSDARTIMELNPVRLIRHFLRAHRPLAGKRLLQACSRSTTNKESKYGR